MTQLKYSGLLVCFLIALAAFSQHKTEQKAEPKFALVKVTVIRDAGGKPVKNAEIVLHPVGKDGKQKQEGLELKTHEDGKAESNGVPYGKVRVQVIAQGFRTYGGDYDIQQPTLEITIKLQRPTEQYSIYK